MTHRGPTVRGALLWSFGERYASLAVTLVGTMVLARLLTPAQVGVFSLCAAFVAVAGILRDFGISEYLIQEKDLTSEKIRAAFSLAILTAWSIAIAILLFRGVVADFYSEMGVEEVLAVLSLNLFIMPFASPAFALLNREMAFRKIFVVQITGTIAHAATSITLAVRGHGYMSLAWASVASTAVQFILLTLYRPRESFLMPGLRNARVVLAYGSMFVTSRTMETFARNAHEFLIARYLGFASVGIFSRALGLIELFYSNVTTAVLRVATPAFAASHRAGGPLAPAFARGTAILTAVAWPFFGFIALLADRIILVLFGSQWGDAAPIASILAIVLMPHYLVALGPNLLAATGQIKRRLQISASFSAVHLLVLVVAAPIDLRAVAAVWGLSGIVMVVLYTRHIRLVLNASLGDLYKPALSSVTLSAASLAAQWGANHFCGEHEIAPLPAIILVASAGLFTWAGVAVLIRHPVFTELKALLRQGGLR